MSTTVTTLAEMRAVTRRFPSGSTWVEALRGVDLRLVPGELVALRGRSGSGKTTLLNILAGLDSPTSGQVLILGRDLAPLDEAARAMLRRESVGMLFQNAHLFPLLTALENVEIPLRLIRMPAAEREPRALEALEAVGLRPRAHHRGFELSGGEQQRVALARALVHRPRLVVADEPTGNLDSLTGRAIINLLRETAHQQQLGLLVATHDAAVVEAADRVLRIHDGQVVEE